MNAPGSHSSWLERNQQDLREEFSWLCTLFACGNGNSKTKEIVEPANRSLALDFLAERFQLSEFERNVLLLCAAYELHPEIEPLCCSFKEQQGITNSTYISFGLALSLLPESHWTALSPDSPLRYWELVQLHEPEFMVRSRISLDETILHFLLGIPVIDPRLSVLLQPPPREFPLTSSQLEHAKRLSAFWSGAPEPSVIEISGNDRAAGLAVACDVCTNLELQPLMLHVSDIPVAAEDRNLLARLLTRQHQLSRSILFLNGSNGSPHLSTFLTQLDCPLILFGKLPEQAPVITIKLEINRPTAPEQKELWQKGLSGLEAYNDSEPEQLAVQFDYSAAEITAATEAIHAETQLGKPLHHILLQKCCEHGRGSLDQLAQRINSDVSWDDLILPVGKKRVLRDICRQVRHRTIVYDTWGFAEKSRRGLGISALFVGESGTGKTLAAEVLASDLGLDLYRIDLSSVVSKYIGETEKNLERLFTAAETTGSILLFDEADALFGKRTEIKDSHDRYANIELSYLLQRMESYRGLSILTSNMKSALDSAFLRRIRFVIRFPFPDIEERKAIWQSLLPDKMPRRDLQPELLARLHLAGGNIRNIALNGAFLAAEKGEPLSMADLAYATRLEYAKLEKPLNESELRKWK